VQTVLRNEVPLGVVTLVEVLAAYGVNLSAAE
jgi:hypothetical protein